MWPYPWTHVGTLSHLGHLDRVAATLPSEASAGAAKEAPDIGQWEGQDVPLVRPSSCIVKKDIPSSRGYVPTYPWFFALDLVCLGCFFLPPPPPCVAPDAPIRGYGLLASPPDGAVQAFCPLPPGCSRPVGSLPAYAFILGCSSPGSLRLPPCLFSPLDAPVQEALVPFCLFLARPRCSSPWHRAHNPSPSCFARWLRPGRSFVSFSSHLTYHGLLLLSHLRGPVPCSCSCLP